MIRAEMGAADLASFVRPAPAEGEAFFELGIKYASGRSGPSDLVAAHKWFNVAFARGTARRRAFGASSRARCRLRRSQQRSVRRAFS